MKNALPEAQKEVSIQPLFGIPIFIDSKSQLLTNLARQIEKGGKLGIVFTPNPEQFTISFHDPVFAKELASATWNLPDGQGIIWALKRQAISRLGDQGIRTIQRIAGREVFHDLLLQAKEKGWKVFLLGGRVGAAETIVRVRGQGSGVNFQFDPGAKDISQETVEEEKRVLEKIRNEKPQILFVAYGAPRQERWILEHRDVLEKAGVRLAMVVGGAFDYEAGLVKPVPSWVQKANLEWLWRLLLEPWRWQRQLRGLEFFWRVLFSRPQDL